MSRTYLLVLLCLGCHAPAQVHPVAPTPTPASPDAASPVAHFSRIETELSALRALPFKHSVPSSTQSRADFRAWVHGELGRELPPEKNQALSHAYADLGLAPQGFDLMTTLEEALTTQVAAYYDPSSKAFRVVGEARDKDVDEIIVAHELTHALDDQHFDLETFDGGEGNRLGLSEDERTARQFVTEGEATFMMLAWRTASGEGAAKLKLSYEIVSENLDGTRRIDVRQSDIEVPVPPRPESGTTVGPKSIFTEWAQQQNVYFAELLRYYPEETFYQYCLLQSQARYGVTPPPLPKPAPDRASLETSLYQIVTGSSAIQDSLQRKMLSGGGSQGQAVQITVQAMDAQSIMDRSDDIASAHYIMAFFSLVVLSVGEIIWSPKLSEYTAYTEAMMDSASTSAALFREELPRASRQSRFGCGSSAPRDRCRRRRENQG